MGNAYDDALNIKSYQVAFVPSQIPQIPMERVDLVNLVSAQELQRSQEQLKLDDTYSSEIEVRKISWTRYLLFIQAIHHPLETLQNVLDASNIEPLRIEMDGVSPPWEKGAFESDASTYLQMILKMNYVLILVNEKMGDKDLDMSSSEMLKVLHDAAAQFLVSPCTKEELAGYRFGLKSSVVDQPEPSCYLFAMREFVASFKPWRADLPEDFFFQPLRQLVAARMSLIERDSISHGLTEVVSQIAFDVPKEGSKGRSI